MHNKNIYKIIAFSLLLICSIHICSIKAYASSKDDVNLYFALLKPDKVPSNFRKTTNLDILKNKGINTTDLSTLNISGSEQFTPDNINILIDSIDTVLKIKDIDLRQESHGFINEYSVSFKNKDNNANKGLSRNLVFIKEFIELNKIKLNKELSPYNKPDISIKPSCIYNESKIAKLNNLIYLRIPVTDRELPTPYMVDYFIKDIKNEKENLWHHFHCEEGVGRTTTFMILYDMIKNYNKVPKDDIIKRQVLLAGLKSEDLEKFTSQKDIDFFQSFYSYLQSYPNFEVSFKNYLDPKQTKK